MGFPIAAGALAAANAAGFGLQLYRSYRSRRYPRRRLKNHTRNMPKRGRARTTGRKRYARKRYKSRRGRSRTAPRTRSRVTTKVLAKRIQRIKKRVNETLATHTRRVVITPAVSVCSTGLGQIEFEAACDTVKLDDAISVLRHFDPANPATPRIIDADSGAYGHEILFRNFGATIEFRNNYLSPFNLTCYLVTPKGAQDNNPVEAIITGMGNQMQTPANATNPTLYPTDSTIFRTRWNIVRTMHKYMAPGAQMTMKYNTGMFTYNPEAVDDRSSHTFHSAYKSACFMWKIVGVPCHDGVTSTLNSSTPSKMDVVIYTHSKVEYDAGMNLEDYSNSLGHDTITQGEIITNPGGALNQLFTIPASLFPET